jgi:molybdopterin synthase catalytic subunit
MISVHLQQDPVSIESALERLETLGGGAVASFVGLVRADDDVEQLVLEYYPGMTEAALDGIAREAIGRWSLLGATIIHRVGPLYPGDRIVLAAACAPHRRDALAACAYMIDRLKTDAPFWKRELRRGKARWVEARDSDAAAAAQWRS